MLRRDDLENIGSLITIKGTSRCLGDLLHVQGRGTFDPTYGRVPITKDEAETHNALLDAAMIAGLDNQCAVGQGASFYVTDNAVKTFSGTVVADRYASVGASIEFRRGDRVFKGRTRKSSDIIFFKRTA